MASAEELQSTDILIVGAGIAGLTLGNLLSPLGHKVTILEKSRGLGGRLATRRIENCSFDHGAPFYQLHTKDQNPNWHSELLVNNKVQLWFKNEETHFFNATKGMTQIAKNLTSKTQIHLNERTSKIFPEESQITVETENNKKIKTKYLILTAPLPQSIELLQKALIPYPEELNEIQYTKALVGLFGIDDLSNLISEFKHEENINESIFSISNQKSKNVSANPALTVLMSSQWSEDHFDQQDSNSIEKIQTCLTDWFKTKNYPAKILFSELKKWRYSRPKNTLKKSFLQLPDQPSIFLTGDSFSQSGDIISTARSAEALAFTILEILNKKS